MLPAAALKKNMVRARDLALCATSVWTSYKTGWAANSHARVKCMHKSVVRCEWIGQAGRRVCVYVLMRMRDAVFPFIELAAHVAVGVVKVERLVVCAWTLQCQFVFCFMVEDEQFKGYRLVFGKKFSIISMEILASLSLGRSMKLYST